MRFHNCGIYCGIKKILLAYATSERREVLNSAQHYAARFHFSSNRMQIYSPCIRHIVEREGGASVTHDISYNMTDVTKLEPQSK